MPTRRGETVYVTDVKVEGEWRWVISYCEMRIHTSSFACACKMLVYAAHML